MTKPYFPGENISRNDRQIRLGSRSKLFDPTPTPPKESKEIPKWIYKLLTIFIAIAVVVWFIFLSPYFKIKNIQINGQASLETKKTINGLIGKNIFLIGANSAEDKLAEDLPGIKEIKILRGVPNSLIINIVERKPVLIWRTQNKDYLVDKDGYLYRPTKEEIFPLITDQKNIPIVIGQRIASNTFVTFIINLNHDLKSQTGLEMASLYVPETTYQIDADTKNDGPRLKLDTTKSLSNQLNAIKYILDHNKDDAKEYIDVRVEGFAYIK